MEAAGAASLAGDFFAMERSEWDPEDLSEKRYDSDKTMRYFEEANRALA